jgi:adenylate kinase family enzyme
LTLQPGSRIRIVGTSGSGKTTLGRRLARRLDLPHVELDGLHWEPGWQPAGRDVFQGRIEEATSGPGWVVDGNYSDAAERALRWESVDTLIFLDYSLPVILRRVTARTLRRMATGVELWNGNRETWRDLVSRDSIILWSLTTYRRRRRQYRALLRRPETAHVTVIHLRSPREAERWLRQVEPRCADAYEERR